MKALVFVLTVLIGAPYLAAQTNEPVRLALIAGSDETRPVADSLTVSCSSDSKIHLLERNEMERIYREQALVAGNLDCVKLGRTLGADGLLLLEVARTPQATNLTARLIAVKPGVVLVTDSFSWPLSGLADWSSSFAQHLDLFLPKLTVLEKDAVPVSIVNLRSAILSDEARETERQVKLLTIQRLSKERQLFVLERQRMELLGEEKDLKQDDSPFWDGSYLLEGVLDQNGYSKDIITLVARLAPPKGGAPIQFEISGSRTNLVELVNQLVLKVEDGLQISPTVTEWDAADEAQQYFVEAKWALRWRLNSEAQMAADSAWALGKHDLDCALARVKSYMAEAREGGAVYNPYGAEYRSTRDARGAAVGARADDSYAQSAVKQMLSQYPKGVTYALGEDAAGRFIRFIFVNRAPSPISIDRAARALELYDDFSHSSSEGEAEVTSPAARTNHWPSPDWYQLGMDDLVAASKVLQDFYLVPEWQPPVADKLADLRARARSVAALISQWPSVHDSYFVGDRSVSAVELLNTIRGATNIFSCELTWGSLWQERPEDCIALYRELMASPVFSSIHRIFWSHRLQSPLDLYPVHDFKPPRLVAWREQDRPRIPQVWSTFIGEMENSTNVLLRLEAKALQFEDADDEKTLDQSLTDLLDTFLENRNALISNRVDVLNLNVQDLLEPPVSLGWDLDGLVVGQTVEIHVDTFRKKFGDRLRAEFLPKIADLEFQRQKQFLMDNKPFDALAFRRMFSSSFTHYSKAQALEIRPLLAAYKAHLTGPLASTAGPMWVQQEEENVSRILGEFDQSHVLATLVPGFRTTSPPPVPNTAPVPRPAVRPPPASPPEDAAYVLVLSNFIRLPSACENSGLMGSAHQWMEGKLMLDVNRVVAIFDPETERWDVIRRPELGNMSPGNVLDPSSALWHGDLFLCDCGQIKKYNFTAQKWEVLEISGEINYNFALFVVNDRLYAANWFTVFEIVDGGKGTRLLASTRRQPPMSVMDTQVLGAPVLFAGPGHSLRIATRDRIFSWTGSDWREDFPMPPNMYAPAPFMDCVLFGSSGLADRFSWVFRLQTEANALEFCLKNQWDNYNGARLGTNAEIPAAPMWTLPAGLMLQNLPVASYRSNLYLLAGHSETREIAGPRNAVVPGQPAGRNQYNGKLLCFSPGSNVPQTLFLKFDPPDAAAQMDGLSPYSRQLPPRTWMLFGGNFLFFGNDNAGDKSGLWFIPVPQLEAAIATEGQRISRVESSY